MANKVEIEIDVDVNNEEAIKKLMDQLEQLKASADEVNVDVKVEDGEVDAAKEKEEELSTTEEVNIEVNETAVQNAIQNISQGFATLKQGASEAGQVLSESLQSAGKQETNFSFLQHALNNDEALAKEKMESISGIVQTLPGDDTAVQGLLSQAIAKDASLAEDELQKIGVAYADYASAMSFYGKSSIEAQQDMTNYILAGNTAELERSPILASHIDKLKEANTIQQRSQVLQEALNEEHWGGMSQQDTFNNKLETFNGMLERGKYTLGGMFQDGAKGLMDFALKLDDASGGLVGIGLAAAGFASPVSDMVMGVGQMATGLKAIKDVGAVTALAEMLPFIVADEEAFLGLALAEGVALGPILAIVAAIALLGVAVFEVGKYFGWWTDVGTMIDAISAGVQRLWAAFINNPDVQAFIQGIKDAWASIQPALGWVISKVLEFFGISTGGSFDIVRALIDGVGAAWNSMKSRILRVINVVRTIINVFSQVLSSAKGFINNVVSLFTNLPGRIQSALSGLAGIITKPFTDAWNSVKNYDWGSLIPDEVSGLLGVEYEGFSGTSVGYEGFDSNDTLNNALTSIANTNNNSSQVIFNNEFHGIIEESASEYIVNSMNDYMKRQNLIRGV
ncbi:MAG: hypothetical protein Q4Q19_03475 [Methanobrevibacter sp.]|nr:hypothetical protein [Methanobrevibacter sp.]